MFACSFCFIETRNNGHLHLNTQGRLHQQPRKDPVKRLVELLPISESWSQAISMRVGVFKDKLTTHLHLEFTCKVLRPKYDETYSLAQYAEVRTKLSVMRAPPHRSVALPFAKMATCNRKTSRFINKC